MPPVRPTGPVPLTSDPHAWLRPYFAALAQDHTFALLAPSVQFSALCDAVRADQPWKVALMREWSLPYGAGVSGAVAGDLRRYRFGAARDRAVEGDEDGA